MECKENPYMMVVGLSLVLKFKIKVIKVLMLLKEIKKNMETVKIAANNPVKVQL